MIPDVVSDCCSQDYNGKTDQMATAQTSSITSVLRTTPMTGSFPTTPGFDRVLLDDRLSLSQESG